MEFSRSWPLAVDASTARRLAVDRKGRLAGFAREGARRVVVTISTGDGSGSTRVHVVREIPTGATSPAATVVGRFLTAEQTEVWGPVGSDGTVAADVDITFPGRPIVVHARIALRPTPLGCEHTISGRAVAHLPGIGRLVERRVVAGMLATVDEQWGDDGRRSPAPLR